MNTAAVLTASEPVTPGKSSIDDFFADCISGMSDKELDEFEKKSQQVMENSVRETHSIAL